MGDIFDDLLSGGADDDPLASAPSVAGGGVLVVGEKAPSGQALHIEEQVYLKSAHIPQTFFESLDSDTGEVEFGNELEFRRAMGSVSPVSLEAAWAWSAERVGAIYAAHREEIDEANSGEIVQAPGANTVPHRAKMPHSTGHNRGQRR